MKLKVIKAIKGLVPGDILEYNEKDATYEIYKVEEDISSRRSTKNTLKVSIGEWLVKDYIKYFDYIDNDGSTIKIEEFDYPNKIVAKDTELPKQVDSEIELLRKEIESLKEQLNRKENNYYPQPRPYEVYYYTQPILYNY